MKIDPELLKYLKGEKFSNSLTVDITQDKYLPVSRESAITETIKDKNVIHLGCSDHIGIIRDKIRAGKWLHKLITDNSESCLGIDIDKQSIDFLRNELGYTNVLQGDILKDRINEIATRKWDFAVFGEIIEHLDDPVFFLKSFKSNYGEYVDNFIITVPSLYCLSQLKNMLNYREVINSDHRFWFTPYTISKILVESGYLPREIAYVNLQSLNKTGLIKRKLKKIAGISQKYPFYYFNTIIITGKINNSISGK